MQVPGDFDTGLQKRGPCGGLLTVSVSRHPATQFSYRERW